MCCPRKDMTFASCNPYHLSSAALKPSLFLSSQEEPSCLDSTANTCPLLTPIFTKYVRHKKVKWTPKFNSTWTEILIWLRIGLIWHFCQIFNAHVCFYCPVRHQLVSLSLSFCLHSSSPFYDANWLTIIDFPCQHYCSKGLTLRTCVLRKEATIWWPLHGKLITGTIILTDSRIAFSSFFCSPICWFSAVW